MRTIVAGSRGVVDYDVVQEAIESAGWRPSVVLSGTANGVDRLGERWAKEHDVPVERYATDWETYGKRAGYIRNTLMATKAEALIAVWDGVSRGTMHMIQIAKNAGLRVAEYRA